MFLLSFSQESLTLLGTQPGMYFDRAATTLEQTEEPATVYPSLVGADSLLDESANPVADAAPPATIAADIATDDAALTQRFFNLCISISLFSELDLAHSF